MRNKVVALSVLLLVGGLFLWTFFPPLSQATYNQETIIEKTVSPDDRFVLTIYLTGGVLLKWDYSYIGVLEDRQTGEEKNVLWLPPDRFMLKWLDEDTILINGKPVTFPGGTKDFR